MKLAPICLFTYNRLEETKLTVEHLQKNDLAKESNLYIFSDGPKNDSAVNSVDAVRQYIKTVDGFAQVEVIESEVNKGLAKSIIEGVGSIVNEYGKVIVLEDDLIISSNFLDFMQQGLDKYEDRTDVLNISGFSYRNGIKTDYDNFFWGRATSWGWATWKDRWSKVDWDCSFDSEKELLHSTKGFNKYGYDLPRMLLRQYNNDINSWAIRWCFHQYKYNLLSVVPIKSKVKNNGFGENATHCVEQRRINVDYDNGKKKDFHFDPVREVSEPNFRHYIKNYSRLNKFVGKILGILDK
jgi:hypothetical protein